jgi:anti-anti-sigma factor
MIAPVGIQVRDREGVPLVWLEGEIDIANAAELRDRLLALLSSNSAPGLIVNLSDVTFVDSRGVHVIFELAERMMIRHQQLRLVVPRATLIRRILLLTHMDEIIPLDETMEDAAAHMQVPR